MFQILNLKAKNFVLFEDLEIDLTSFESNLVFINGLNKDVAAAGGNGAGKTLLGDLISDLLFDKTIRRHSPSSFIGDFGKWCMSSMIVRDLISEDKYSIKKYRNHPDLKDSLKFKKISGKKKVDLSKKKKADTYNLIWEVFGISWGVFKNRNYFAQDDNDRFLNVTDTKKADIIIESQNLKDLQIAKKMALSSAKKNSSEKEKIEIGLKQKRESLEDLRSILEEKMETIDKEITLKKKKIKELLEAITALKIKKENCSIQSEKIDEVRNKLASLTEQQSKFQKLSDLLNKKERELLSLKNEIENETSDIDELTEKISESNSELKDLKNRVITRCSKCGTVLDQEKRDITAKNVKLEIQKSKKLIEKSKKRIIAKKSKKENLSAETKKLFKEVEGLSDLFDEKEEKLKELREMEKWQSEGRIIRERISSKEAEIDSCKERIKVLESGTEQKNLKDKISKLKKEILNMKQKVKKLSENIDKDEFAKNAFDKTIRLLFNNFLNNLNHFSNEFLGILSDNDVSVVFQPKTKNKSKKIVDKINVLVSIAGGKPRDFRTYSGGEKKRIELSTQLALFSSDDSSLPFLFLDEPFHAVHPVGRERIIELLETKANEGNLVLVTNSENEIPANACSIYVKRENNRSIMDYG